MPTAYIGTDKHYHEILPVERHGVVVCAISSGGKFRAREPGTIELPYSNDEHDWHVAGPGVQLLIRIDIPSLTSLGLITIRKHSNLVSSMGTLYIVASEY